MQADRPRGARSVTPRHLLAVAAALVAAAALATVAVLAQHVQKARALDATVRADVGFTARLAGPQVGGAAVLRLAFTGHTPVVVQRVWPMVPGYDPVTTQTAVSSNGSFAVDLLPSHCPDDEPTATLGGVLVVATTDDDQPVYRFVPIGAEVSETLVRQLRSLCGYPPEDTLVGRVLATRMTGQALEVTYSLANRALVPVAVVGVRPVPGFGLLQATVPLFLSPGDGHGPGPSQTLRVRMGLSDCSTFALTREGIPAGLVRVTVVIGFRIGHAELPLVDRATGEGQELVAPLRRLTGVCRGT